MIMVSGEIISKATGRHTNGRPNYPTNCGLPVSRFTVPLLGRRLAELPIFSVNNNNLTRFVDVHNIHTCFESAPPSPACEPEGGLAGQAPQNQGKPTRVQVQVHTANCW